MGGRGYGPTQSALQCSMGGEAVAGGQLHPMGRTSSKVEKGYHKRHGRLFPKSNTQVS